MQHCGPQTRSEQSTKQLLTFSGLKSRDSAYHWPDGLDLVACLFGREARAVAAAMSCYDCCRFVVGKMSLFDALQAVYLPCRHLI